MARPSFSGALTISMRIIFVLLITGAVMAGVLKLLERAGDPLRQGIEGYIADLTKNHAYLSALPDPKLIPNVRMTLEGLVISRHDDATQKMASVESIHFSLPFINTLIARPVFETVAIKNAVIEKDVLFARRLHIAQGVIEAEEGTDPVFHLSGDLGGTAASLVLGLESKGRTPPRYTLPKESAMTYRQGDITVHGTLQSMRGGLRLTGMVMQDESGKTYGPQDFFLLQNQSFVKDNPISCLMGLPRDSKLTDTHPCAMLFKRNDQEIESAE